MHPREYAKAIIAFLSSLAAWGATAAPDGYQAEELWVVLKWLGRDVTF